VKLPDEAIAKTEKLEEPYRSRVRNLYARLLALPGHKWYRGWGVASTSRDTVHHG
jgi:hypothetical protein